MKPEDGIECGHFDDSHVAEPKDVVQAVMKCLEVTNNSAISLIAHSTKGLIGRQELVEHVAKIGLLFDESQVDFVVAASSVWSVRIKRIADSMIPELELEFALHWRQLTLSGWKWDGRAYQGCEIIISQRMKVELV